MTATTESFSSKVNKRILEMEKTMRGKDGLLHPGKPGNKENVPAPKQQRSFIDDKIDRYRAALQEAMRNAPCGGCKRLVLSALVGLAIFEAMSESGKSREDISDADIDRIKKEVEQKYANY